MQLIPTENPTDQRLSNSLLLLYLSEGIEPEQAAKLTAQTIKLIAQDYDI